MSNAIFDDSITHGTPEGYDAGCRSAGGCPARTDHGLTCAEAKTFDAGNYRYRQLRGRGLSPAEIAAQFDFHDDHATQTPPAPVSKPATKPKPKARPKPPAPTPAPDVPEIDTDTNAAEPPEQAEPVRDPREASNAEIRAWARDRGYDVNPTGPVRRGIREHYIEAHTTAADAPRNVPAPDPDLDELTGKRGIPTDPEPEAPLAPGGIDTDAIEAGVDDVTLEPAKTDRPEWADVATSADLTAAQDALALERGAHVKTARSLALVLTKWATAQDRIEQLQAELIRIRTDRDEIAIDFNTASEDRARALDRVETLHNENIVLRAALADAKRARRGWFGRKTKGTIR
ncbi:Lsr2 family protein [Microbacterium karelineae]|uniref:Lsr2 family protein n=1 Tax=Microbacterium karelineae TaxID=2654283 RepID=UPI0012E9F78C|nr:Lsr2 family protein [Microbacterium karelineae]